MSHSISGVGEVSQGISGGGGGGSKSLKVPGLSI